MSKWINLNTIMTQRERIIDIECENAELRELIVKIWNVARLMDANRHIDGMRITEEFRMECEKAFKELGIEVDE